MRPNFRVLAVALLSVMLAASGCSTTARVWTGGTSAAAVLPEVEANDRVLLVLRSGRELHCPVTGFDAEFVYGCRNPVALQNIHEVRFRNLDGVRALTLRDLHAGDEVTVFMRSGDVRLFRLVAMQEDRLQGEQFEVAISEIDRMSVSRTSGARSLGAVFTAVGAVCAVVLVVMITAMAGGEEE